MTEPSKAAVEKACEMLELGYPAYAAAREKGFVATGVQARVPQVARFIDHVSEVAASARAAIISYSGDYDEMIAATLVPFILPDPEPDVLAEAIAKAIPRGLVIGDDKMRAAIVADVVDAVRKVQP